MMIKFERQAAKQIETASGSVAIELFSNSQIAR